MRMIQAASALLALAAALLLPLPDGAASAQVSPWEAMTAPVGEAAFQEAKSAAQQRDWVRAAPMLAEVLRMQQAELGDDHWASIRTSVWLGQSMVAKGGADRDPGLAMLENALSWYDRQGEQAANETVRLALLLSRLYTNHRNFPALERLEQRTMSRLLSQIDDIEDVRLNAAIQETRRNLARLAEAQGRTAEADALYAQNLPELEASLARLMPQLRATAPASPFNGLIGQSTDAQAEAVQLILAMAGEARGRSSSRRTIEVERLLLETLALAEATGGQETIFYIRTVSDLAEFYVFEGRMADAEQRLLESVRLRERTYPAESPQRLPGLSALASFYRSTGRLADAERTLLAIIAADEAMRRTSESLFGSRAGTVAAQVALADLYIAQGRFAEAEMPLTNALQMVNDAPAIQTNEMVSVLVPQAAGAGRTIEREIALATSRLWLRQGAFEQAALLITDAHDVTQPVTTANLPYVLALAEVRDAEGQWQEAESLYRRAIELQAMAPLQRWTISVRLAQVQRRKGDHAAAQARFQAIVDEAAPLLGDGHPLIAEARSGVATTLLNQSRGDEALALVRQINALRRDAAATLDLTARQQRERELIGNSAPLQLANALWLSADANGRDDPARQAEVFTALQDGMASPAGLALLRAAARRLAQQAGPEPLALVDRQEQLTAALATNQEQFVATLGQTSDTAEARRRALAAERERLGAGLAANARALDAAVPGYFAMLQPQATGLAAMQAALAPDEAMLVAMPSPFGTHLLALTREGSDWARSDWSEGEIDAAVQRLRRDLGASYRATPDAAPASGTAATLTFDRATAHALHGQLIAPVAERLQGKRRLLVVAGGSLAALPFHTLVSAPPSGSDSDPDALRTTRWLGDDFALVHAASVQSVALLRATAAPPRRADFFIGIGDPVLTGSGSARGMNDAAGAVPRRAAGPLRSGSGYGDVDVLRRMARLPGTARELNAVRDTLGAPADSLLLADRATEHNVRNAPLADRAIILFSTHGLTAGEAIRAGLSEAGLVLTPPATASATDDGFLAASEIAALRLTADWVILSACNTATGDGIGEAGLGELARAFLFAGARNLLASHWPVSDEVAPILITRTLELEREGVPRAVAFQSAMREARTNPANPDWAHPFFWAPFVLIGDGR